MRTIARETVFKYIFSRLFNASDEGLFVSLIKDAGLNLEDANFAHDLLLKIDEGEARYLEEIEDLSVGYSISRVFPADKCAIILGMAELEGYPSTPTAVVIDEAVKLAAKYSTEKSTDFVNGILAQFVKKVRN